MKQVNSDKYFNPSYDKKSRFNSYWHQINEIIRLESGRVLEIGIGSGFVFEYLKKRGVDVTALDIDEKLNPDIVGSILNLPIKDNSFGCIACYEVLEHLPYNYFQFALSEIFRISSSYAILSLPDVRKACRFFLEIPMVGGIQRIISLPRLRKLVHEFDGQHYWEIGNAGYSLSKIINDIQKTGFKVQKTYRSFEHIYHRFFVLKK